MMMLKSVLNLLLVKDELLREVLKFKLTQLSHQADSSQLVNSGEDHLSDTLESYLKMKNGLITTSHTQELFNLKIALQTHFGLKNMLKNCLNLLTATRVLKNT